MTMIEKCVNKPVTITLVFIILTLFGMFGAMNLAVDMYPNMDIPYLIVITEYENAGPEEIEQNVTKNLESSLSGLTGLKKMQSQSKSGASLIILEMEYGTNLDSAANDVRDKIDLVRSYLPDDADTPITIRLDPSMMPIMTLALEGDRSPDELAQYAKDIVQPRLEQLSGIASADMSGDREKSINIDIPRDRLEAYGLTITQVAKMVASQNIQSSGGRITTGDTNYTIKTAGKFEDVETIRNTVISYNSTTDGIDTSQVRTVLLRDIADVYAGFKDQTTLSYINGKACISLDLQKQSGKNSVTAAHTVRKQLKSITASLPADVKLTEAFNNTDTIESTINEVVNSVVQGAALAIVVLFIFLRSLKSTVIIGLSIPVSVSITIAIMYLRGMTLNSVSLAGLLLGIGMLVDNSIVVLENIFTYRSHNAKPKTAAVLGTSEMINSVTASTLTSVCIFLPMIMLSSRMGMMGQLFNDLAYTIVFSLLCSLFTALFMVPVLSSSVFKLDNVENPDTTKLSGKLNVILGNFFNRMDLGYAGLVKKVLRFRVLVIGVLVVLVVMACMSVGWLGFIFMPEATADNVSISFTLPQGTKIEVTEETVQQMESIARQVLKGIRYTMVTVGGSSKMSSASETNTGTLRIMLYSAKDRHKDWDTDKTAKAKLRPYFNQFPGTDVTFSQAMGGAGNSGISIDIKSNDLDLVRNTSKQIADLLKTKAQDMVSEVTVDLKDGLPQIEIILDRDRMYELGINVATVGSEIDGAINGAKAGRYSDAGDDIDIMVRFAEADREKVTDLDQIYVTNTQGKRIALSNFARSVMTTAPVTIYREDQSRIAHVTSKPLPGVSLGDVMTRMQTLVRQNVLMEGDLNITYSGDFEDMAEAATNFGLVIIMATILVFAVMASQFESLKNPFIVMFTIPLALIGVATIYALKGQTYSVVSIIGLLTLVGTIVNNGIVLVDMTNLYRKRGLALEDAIVTAAGSRLRPILMSTLTTIISLIPMAFFPGEGTEGLQPVGLTVFGGMTFGSMMTLFVMPTIYFMFNKKNEARKVAAQKLIDERNAKWQVESQTKALEE